MAELWIDPEKEVAVAEDDDRVYEEIEAPKFVDFTAPDLSLPDSSSWFCVRIGCDQKHEEVDPDTLYKNFVLKVMAARSPNVRLQRRLNGRGQSATPKCPQTAPVKSAKDRIQKVTTIASISEKAGNGKLKAHPISSLRSTPKAKTQPSLVSKALTTPMNKKCPHNVIPRSVQTCKVCSSMPKNNMVVKSLVFNSPKKAVHNASATKSRTPISEMCSGMEKLHIGSQAKHPSRHLCKSLKGTANNSSNKKSTSVASKSNLPISKLVSKNEEDAHQSCVRRDMDENNYSDMEIDGKSRSSSMRINPVTGDSRSVDGNGYGEALQVPSTEEKILVEKEIVQQTSHEPANKKEEQIVDDVDEDKENASVNFHNRGISVDRENIDQQQPFNYPTQDIIEAPGKSVKELYTQGGKYRKMKTTNPKPFRLRTDERSILKEANLEKRVQQEALKEITLSCVKPERSAGSVTNITPQRRKLIEHNKESLKSRCKIRKLALLQETVNSSRHMATVEKGANGGILATVLAPKAATTPGEAPEDSNRMTTTTPSRIRKPTTIPKEPNFHRMHVPKSCTKRAENPLP